MKKLITYTILAAAGTIAVFNWGTLSIMVAGIFSEQAADEDDDVEDLIVDDGNEVDLLEQLAARNILFRWSLEFENENADGMIFTNPDIELFRQWYDSFESPQTWKNYSGWVKVFYDGNIVSKGWIKTGKQIVDQTEDPDRLKYVNVLGRVLAAEWCKDNDLRKFHNFDLYRWGNDLKSGKATLKQIAMKVCAKLEASGQDEK